MTDTKERVHELIDKVFSDAYERGWNDAKKYATTLLQRELTKAQARRDQEDANPDLQK